MKRALILACAIALLPAVSGADVVRVPDDVASIPMALFLASSYDTILVAPGTYSVNLEWPDKDGLKLLSEEGPAATILDGGHNVQVIGIYVKVDTTTVVRGFTIQNGHAEGQ